MTDPELVQEALQARGRAYAPYSQYAVGAALLTRSGRVFHGANVENASYGLSICAERVALASAVASGERAFVKLAVACDAPDGCRPCGACRQVLWEFAPDLIILRANPKGDYRVSSLKELLPEPFARVDHRPH